MKVNEIVQALDLTVATKNSTLTAEVTGGYASDLLSNVMGQASAGMVWVTMQGHQNIVAIGSLLGLAAIIVTGGTALEEATLAKAEANDLVVLTTDLPSYEVVGRLYMLGVKNL
ncbi:MAG: DRTGG domain-containing protein [Acidaminococcaceae bacterium]